jgi:DNA-binding response OmpR family regulator
MEALSGESMTNVLLIHDVRYSELSVQKMLTANGITPVCLDIDEFHPELLLTGIFDLIIFELYGESRLCIFALQQLERWSATSGIEHPPVIVVSEESSGSSEQTLRRSKANFYFIKPVAEAELLSAIDQSLLQYKIA